MKWFNSASCILGAVFFSQACVAHPDAERTFSFAERDDGKWISIPVENLSRYLNTSKVSCSARRSQIEFVWNSEDGDWAAFDKYSSDGNFFSRTIRFAQFDEIVEVTKSGPKSKPALKIGGSNVEQYDYLISELKIWTNVREFPYTVPPCALEIFEHNSR